MRPNRLKEIWASGKSATNAWLAIPSIFAGFPVGRIVFGGYFGDSIAILPEHPGLAELSRDFHGALGMITHGVFTTPFWLVSAGIATAFARRWKLRVLPFTRPSGGISMHAIGKNTRYKTNHSQSPNGDAGCFRGGEKKAKDFRR